MKLEFAFLLLLLAITLVVIFSLLNKMSYLSNRIKSRRYRKTIFLRLAVIVLLIATIAIVVSPHLERNNLSNVLLFCAFLLISTFLVYFFIALRYEKKHVKKPVPTENNGVYISDGIDSRTEVLEQLDRVSDLIDSHDLENSDISLSDDVEKARFPLRSDVALSIESTLKKVDISSTALSNMSPNELSMLVTTLRIDKTKLQKLIIAQQAAIESERTAHEQSRVIARDAIKSVQDARDRQKFAEKMARRQKTKRKRVEQKYKKVANALDTAMSITESRKAEKEEESSS